MRVGVFEIVTPTTIFAHYIINTINKSLRTFFWSVETQPQNVNARDHKSALRVAWSGWSTVMMASPAHINAQTISLVQNNVLLSDLVHFQLRFDVAVTWNSETKVTTSEVTPTDTAACSNTSPKIGGVPCPIMTTSPLDTISNLLHRARRDVLKHSAGRSAICACNAAISFFDGALPSTNPASIANSAAGAAANRST
jgi:hypothetical protein